MSISPADAAALRTLQDRLPQVADVTSVRALASAHGTEVIQVTPGTSPEAQATSRLITTLRDHVIPAAERGTTLRVYVGGVTAAFADFAAVVTGKLPWFILAIVGGDANWWLPGWKDRLLPHLAIEPPKETPAPALR